MKKAARLLPGEERWLTVREYCTLRGIHPQTAYKDRCAGRGPDFFQGVENGLIRYRLSDVQRYMDRNTRRPRARASA